MAATLQVSISLNKVELSVGESKFFICTGTHTHTHVRAYTIRHTPGCVWRWVTDVKPALVAWVYFPGDDKCDRVLHMVSATLTPRAAPTPPPQCLPRRV